MTENTISPELFAASLPGAWIAEHPGIWQMDLLSASELARFCHDRGLSFSSFEDDITQLWQLGLLKADLVESRREYKRAGLIDSGKNSKGHHIYSDERRLRQRPKGLRKSVKTARSLPAGVKLLFHPFRYYVLYHLDKALELNISRMQMFNQEGYPRVLDFILSRFNQWSSSDQFVSRIDAWNDIASLAIVTEPCIYVRIFHFIRYSLSEIHNMDIWREEIQSQIDRYWQDHVADLYQRIGIDRLEEIRQELCVDTQRLDSNRWIHTLLCLGDSKLRLELKDHLGGALTMRTMAEMLRRATEETFNTTLREEDELGFGWVPNQVKETLYGSNRLLDDHQAAETFARRHGLNYKPRVHLYGEGDTEYGALNSFFGTMGIKVTNLHGLIKEGKSKTGEPIGTTFFRDYLYADIREQTYSIVVIDMDVEDNVRALRSAARNNQTSENEGIFGRYFLSNPDFEFANFEVEELEKILWNWVGGESPGQAERELLHSYVKTATNGTEFFKGVKHTAQSLVQLYGYDKCEKWGEELMRYAWEHQLKQNQERQIVEVVKLALYWEKTISLERYELAKKKYMVDPETGRLVNRPTPTPQREAS